MTATVDPHHLAREGLVFIDPEGELARWVEQVIRAEDELENELPFSDGLFPARCLETGLQALHTVRSLLCDLVAGGLEFEDDEGRENARMLIEVMVR